MTRPAVLKWSGKARDMSIKDMGISVVTRPTTQQRMLWWLSLLWDFRSATSFLPLDLIALFRVHPARAVGSLRASRQALASEPGSGRGMKLKVDVRVADCARTTLVLYRRRVFTKA